MIFFFLSYCWLWHSDHIADTGFCVRFSEWIPWGLASVQSLFLFCLSCRPRSINWAFSPVRGCWRRLSQVGLVTVLPSMTGILGYIIQIALLLLENTRSWGEVASAQWQFVPISFSSVSSFLCPSCYMISKQMCLLILLERDKRTDKAAFSWMGPTAS